MNPELDSTTLMKAAQVQALFQVDPRTLFNWKIAEILIPKKIKGRLYYYRADVLNLLSKTL
jgi:hypothetical protein